MKNKSILWTEPNPTQLRAALDLYDNLRESFKTLSLRERYRGVSKTAIGAVLTINEPSDAVLFLKGSAENIWREDPEGIGGMGYAREIAFEVVKTAANTLCGANEEAYLKKMELWTSAATNLKNPAE